jgi:hypothetical protein
MADEVKMTALRTHSGAYGHVRKGDTFTVSEREARGFERSRFPVAERAGDAEPEAAEPTHGDAVDLREVAVKDLDAALADIEDVDLIRSMMDSDDRTTAGPKYEARLAELEAE